MKTQFWTRKGYIGLLMTLVLMFGVQGVADAISSTGIRTSIPGSGVNPSKVEVRAGQEFEITLTFSLQSRTRIRVAGDYQADDSYTTANAVVDSAGYLINDNGHRTLTDETYVTSQGDTDYPLQARDPNGRYAIPDTPYASNSSGSVYDANGYPVYPYRATDLNADPVVTEHRKAQVKALAAHWTKVTPEKHLYYYDEEQITITPTTGVTLRLKSGHPIAGGGTALEEAISGEAKPAYELRSSVTLICSATQDGSFTVTNSTPNSDYPANAAERRRTDSFPASDRLSKLVEFSVLVLPAPTVESNSFLTTSDKVVRIDELFLNSTNGLINSNLDAGAADTVVYEVIRGSGRLYTEIDATHYTQFTRHEDLEVYIDLNRMDNEVSAYVTGHFDGRKILPIRYTGLDRRDSDDSGSGGSGNEDDTPPPTNTISVSSTSLRGAPGTTQDITVTAGTATVRVQGSSGFTSAGGAVSGSGTVRTITLPRTAANYILTVSASGYTDRQISVTVEAPQALGTLTVSKDGAQTGLQQQILVRASSAPSRTVAFTVTRGGVRVGSGEILTTGSGRAIVSVPATGTYILTVSATGYTPQQVTFTAGAQTTTTTTDTTTPTTPTTTTPTVSEPSSLQIAGQSTRSGTANTALDAPLLVRVLDDDGDAVAETRVIFRVRTGQGRLSERGNGRAIALQTDTNGYARAPYTPISASSTVEAEASGVTRRVTFTITASGGAATPTTSTTRDTTSSTISPVVQTAAAKRPPMLWVDNGAIYALVDTDVQRFAPTVDNALSLAIGGDTVYWTEKTGDSAGTINSANLDGTGIKELKAIMAVPMGITVDTTANLLYWTNSRGRIQSLNADGSGRVENVLQNLTSPLDIGLAGGNVYWTHSNGGIGFASLKGQKQVRNISNGADAAGSLVIGGGKVYWTEETGENGGRIKSANLNGSGITDVASIFAVPIGIGLDSSRGKLFWTNSRGRIQSSDLEGNGVSNVVDGLGHPGDMVLSNSIAAPAATTTTTTTTADNAKYDVNGDGTVDNMDAGLVSEAMGTSNAKYDVNNDGTVNFLDLLLVFDNRDEGAASAPTVLGMQLSAVQVDVLQEQIDLLIATGDRSPAAMRTLIYLQQLIATARPEQTQLLANYPNPFNPETWIPYELATDTDVRLTIYNTHGAVIRTLQLGHQRTGYYVGRDRAAYWDGRNAYGEQVASGIYFYQLETDAMSLMRKMVILK